MRKDVKEPLCCLSVVGLPSRSVVLVLLRLFSSQLGSEGEAILRMFFLLKGRRRVQTSRH